MSLVLLRLVSSVYRQFFTYYAVDLPQLAIVSMLKMDGMVKHWIRFRHGHATEYGNLQRMTRQTAASRASLVRENSSKDKCGQLH